MKDIFFDKIGKRYENEVIISDLTMTIPGGSFFTLLGPSGSGKTTLLGLIGGSIQPTTGKILVDGIDVTELPPNKRGVNTIFQNYALFPHLNVYENIAYGLMVKKKAEFEIKKAVEKYAELFDITKFLYKSIQELSGGQQQRVAMARAIINDPSILLLDEPLSAIDMRLKKQLLRELSNLRKQLNMTFVFVTHEQSEALAVSDYIAVLETGGKVAQVGTPQEIYETPQSLFVAQFIGNSNNIEGYLHKKDGNCFFVTDSGSRSYRYIHGDEEKKNQQKRKSMLLLLKEEFDKKNGSLHIRPEHLFLCPVEDSIIGGAFENGVEGKVISMMYYGYAREYSVLTPIGLLKIFDFSQKFFTPDDAVMVQWRSSDALFLERIN